MKNTTPVNLTRVIGGLLLVGFCVTDQLLTPEAPGQERRFAVMLAVPKKSAPTPPPIYPNPNDIYDQYFDTQKDDIESFSEYWWEISYNTVNVTGDVFGWVEVPWPVLPQGDFDVPMTVTTISNLVLPFEDLNGSGRYDAFGGEAVPASQNQMILIDYNGELPGTGTPMQPPNLVVRTPGLVDFDAANEPVWTPGERFEDLDGEGDYDALLEDVRDGWNNDCEADGIIQSEEVCDLDNDNSWDFPEPFEDFLVIYNPMGETPQDRWIKLDPSDNNTFEGSVDDVGSRVWAEAYIRRNYPGDADALIDRCGNGVYDGPDLWIENGQSKVQQQPGNSMWSAGLTPKPNEEDTNILPQNYSRWDYEAWWAAYWAVKHEVAGVTPDPVDPTAPDWPEITPFGNVPNMQPFDPDDPAIGGDRNFRPNVGGTLTRSGTMCTPDSAPPDGCSAPPSDPENSGDGSVDPENSGTGTPGTILPDTLDTNNDGDADVYDGPAEFDDVPSSIYHARSVAGVGDHPDPNSDLPGYGGDGRLGEVTSTLNTSPTGHDIGGGDPSSPSGNDGITPAGGPLAFNVHGTNGYDGGNVFTLEFMTWRTQEPSSPAMKRDFNLDGLLDMGEVRNAGTENYAIDLDPGSSNNGGPSDSVYPFNRTRLVEDTIAALDPSVDWDNLAMPATVNIPNSPPIDVNYVFSTVLVPAGLYQDGLAEGGRGLFQLPAPAMLDFPVQVQEQGGGDLSPLFFSDFVTGLDGTSETNNPLDGSGFAKELMAHEFLHVWEGFPDLYDYDVYISGIENNPVGIWDIMSGGFVHPSPFLKEFGVGVPNLGTAHEPWAQATDLRDVMKPLEQTDIVLTDFAFDPVKSVYYYENPNNAGERFYFWRLTRLVPTDPDLINFSKSLPGDGVMIMHTDFGQNFEGFDGNLEGFPQQQRIGTHAAYNILQADGLQQLENGENAGDEGDPFPSNNNAGQLTEDSDPNTRWWGQVKSGIEVTRFTNSGSSSTVTFFWKPRWVPELFFTQPPGGFSAGGTYKIKYEAFDIWGGTMIEFYYDTDNQGYDGTLIGDASKLPGVVTSNYDVPLASLADGEYFFYARLVPGPGNESNVDPAYSEPRASAGSRARGNINNIVVNIGASKLENITVTCTSAVTPGFEIWQVEGSISGPLPDAITGVPYGSANEMSFTIDWDGIFGSGAAVSNAGGNFKLTDLGAGFVASDFKPNDTVRILNGPNPGYYTITSVPSGDTLMLETDPGDASGINYRVHSFSDGSDGSEPDAFSFVTTGKTPYSASIFVENGEVTPHVFPDIQVSYPDAASNPQNAVPLRVRFDATGSKDENGQDNPSLLFNWDFGDGEPDSSAPVVVHTFVVEPDDGTRTVTLTVTNPNTSVNGSKSVEISMTAADSDNDGIPNTDDNCPNNANPGQEDTDGDGFADACDNCPGIWNGPQEDGDFDGAGDACDGCPTDWRKSAPGICGCGNDDADFNGNGVTDCLETGSGGSANDTDGDGIPNNQDGCPNDPAKVNPGPCGCGIPENDSDGDGILDCRDNCPSNPNPRQTDSDFDGVGDDCDSDSTGDAGQNLVTDGSGPGCGLSGFGLILPMLTVGGLISLRRRRGRR